MVADAPYFDANGRTPIVVTPRSGSHHHHAKRHQKVRTSTAHAVHRSRRHAHLHRPSYSFPGGGVRVFFQFGVTESIRQEMGRDHLASAEFYGMLTAVCVHMSARAYLHAHGYISTVRVYACRRASMHAFMTYTFHPRSRSTTNIHTDNIVPATRRELRVCDCGPSRHGGVVREGLQARGQHGRGEGNVRLLARAGGHVGPRH